MIINRIKISNILGIKEFEFTAGKFNEISGKNGVGKTSILEAIKNGLKGGNDVTLLRNGEEKGEVVLEFDNGVKLQRTVNGKSNLKLTDENGRAINKPQTFIDGLTDLFSYNPIEFMITEPKVRAEVLLKTLNLELLPEELNDVFVGYTKETITPYFNGNALDIIAKIDKDIRAERTGVNRILKEKQATINQLQESIQKFEVIPGALEAQIEELETKQKARLALKESYMTTFNEELQKNIEIVNNEEKEFIDSLNKEKEEFLAKLNARKEDKLAEFAIIRLNNQTEFETKKAGKITGFEGVYNPAQEQLAMLREQLKQVGAVNNTLENINRNEESIELLSKQSEELTESIKILEEIKLSKLNNLPIKGLEVVDGQIIKDGVFFDRLNTAEQIKLAIEVAKLRAGELGIVCLDGLERFDKDTYEIFKEQMIASNLQAIITRVSDEELKVMSN